MRYDLNDKNTAAVQNKINLIILDALRDKRNWEAGEVNWNFVDGDLHCDERSEEFTDQQLVVGLHDFPMSLITPELQAEANSEDVTRPISFV